MTERILSTATPWPRSHVTRNLSLLLGYRRGGAPGPLFLTLGLREPRGSVRFGLGGRFLRAFRFNFLRSTLSLMFFVFINMVNAP